MKALIALLFLVSMVQFIINFIKIVSENEKLQNRLNRVVNVTTSIIFVFMIVLIDAFNVMDKQPNAMDVYRDKTELKLTYTISNTKSYTDTIKIDSTVIYKPISIIIE